MNETLDRILHKFNLSREADYSKVSMPLALNLNRRQLAELFAELGCKVGVEIGTAEGLFAEVLCKANPELKLFCVDPYRTYGEYRDYKKQGTLDWMFETAKAKLQGYNVQFARMPSVEAAALFGEESVDFAYIDANHSFEHVVADIAAWLPKLKSGGCCAGHDFSHPKGKQFGVVEAVTGWVNAYNVRPWFVLKGEYEAVGDRSHSWMFLKP